MRRALLILLILLVPTALYAAQDNGGSSVAHGSEKVGHEVAHPNEEHGGGEGGAPKTYFGIPGWILKLANMLLFLGALIWAVKGPLATAFADRSNAIRKAADEARARRQKSDRMADDIQARLAQVEAEVKAIHERAIADGERQKKELIAAAEAEAQKILQSARSEVDNRLKHARKELTEYAGELATQRAETILKEKITADDQRKLFQDSLREVEEVRS